MKFIQNILFLFKYSWGISKCRFGAAGVDIISNSIEPFIYLIFPTLIINELTGSKKWDRVLFNIGLFIVCVLLFRALKIILNVFINLSINRSDVKNGIAYANHFVKMDYDKLEDEKIRDMQQKVSSNVRENEFVIAITSFLTNIIVFCGFSYIIAMLEPGVLLMTLAVVIINYFLNQKISNNNYEYQPILAKFTRIFEYLFSAMVTFDYAKEVRINRANSILLNKFNKTIGDFSIENKAFLYKQMRLNILINIISFVQMIMSYGYVVYSIIINKITVGEFSLYIGAIYNLSGAFNNVAAQCIKLKYLSACVEDYKEYIKQAMPQDAEKEKNDLPAEVNNLPMFEFENISFKYPNTDKEALKNISIKINKGEKLAVVGLNGAGKTTFIKLICRLYTPTSGTIKYYGVDVSTIKRDEYMKMLAVVFQDFKIFSFSLLENIVLNREFDKEKFDKVIHDVNLNAKIASLSNGINTNIYKDFDENGIEFSGGEGQKLVIARACYKDASLIIMDEPTAALDALAENEIYQSFYEMTLNKTSIFISHRLASTRFCDNIAVFASGEIVEYGSHAELLKRNGLYAEMFDKQAKYYKTNVGRNE